MTLADWERRNLERIERELANADPGLARLLNAPGKWRQMCWGPRRTWLVTAALILVAAACVLSLVVSQ
ncbi:MAG TPA: DUF3040 domain-containing protein [Actinocrinis sp.]|nr:DUF3040 domain-containing protein [Actinocrinis sp.]